MSYNNTIPADAKKVRCASLFITAELRRVLPPSNVCLYIPPTFPLDLTTLIDYYVFVKRR